MELSITNAIMTSLALINKQLNDHLKSSKMQAKFVNCVEQVMIGNNEDSEYVTDKAINISNNRQPYDPYSFTYNPGWKVHPNLVWANNQQSTQESKPIAKYQLPIEFDNNMYLQNSFSKFQSNDSTNKEDLAEKIIKT